MYNSVVFRGCRLTNEAVISTNSRTIYSTLKQELYPSADAPHPQTLPLDPWLCLSWAFPMGGIQHVQPSTSGFCYLTYCFQAPSGCSVSQYFIPLFNQVGLLHGYTMLSLPTERVTDVGLFPILPPYEQPFLS